MKYKDFLNWVDIEKFAEACHNISNSSGAQILNEHSNRMLKEKFILGALVQCTHKNNIQWLDKIDYDMIFVDWGDSTVEVKTGNGPMYTEKRGDPKKHIEVKLKNIYESKANTRTTLDKTFDHLMIVQNTGTFAIGFVPFSTLTELREDGKYKYINSLTDGWKARLPFDVVDIVYSKDMRNYPITWTVNLDPKLWVMDKLKEAGL